MRYARGISIAVLLLTTPVVVRAQASTDILGAWRVVRAVPAPWAVGAKGRKPNAPGWIGKTIRFEPHRVVGPGILRCANAVYAPTHFEADALFQGALPAPATKAAESLGLTEKSIAGTNLGCDSGEFEIHRADASTLLLGLNDVVYTLDRSPGALASDTSAGGVVQRLLERHFAGNMGFGKASVATKARWLSSGLSARIARYFTRPSSPNEAPVIDGDPFTDSQEYPTRFSVSDGVVAGDRATVAVRFADGHAVRPVTYVLRREHGAWRVDDVRYDKGRDFSTLLE